MSAIGYIRECIVEQLKDMGEGAKLEFLTDIFILTEDMRHELVCDEEVTNPNRRTGSKKKAASENVISESCAKSECSLVDDKQTRERSDEKPVIPYSSENSECSQGSPMDFLQSNQDG